MASFTINIKSELVEQSYPVRFCSESSESSDHPRNPTMSAENSERRLYKSLKIVAALSISSGLNTNRHLASGDDTEP